MHCATATRPVTPRAFAALTAAALTTAAHAAVINDFNLVVLGNHHNVSDVEGRTLVGGNLTGGGTYASRLNAGAFAGTDTLRVGGNVSVSNIALQAGNLRLSGTRTGNVNFNGGGTQITDPSVAASISGVAAELTALSQSLRGLATNSAVQLPGGQPGPARFTPTPGPSGVAVFSVSGNALFASNLVQQIELSSLSASAIVVNVSGTTINFNQGNFVGNWTNNTVRATTIWNFFEATSLSFDRNFNGTVLAPTAHLTITTSVDGSVFVGSFNQRGEVHLPNFNVPPSLIPAPGAAAGLALLGLAAARRRRAEYSAL
jgi:choice-of-anchor A domain-containing protein